MHENPDWAYRRLDDSIASQIGNNVARVAPAQSKALRASRPPQLYQSYLPEFAPRG